MRRTLWLILAVLLLGAWTFIVFEVGGREGFVEGYTTATHSDDVTSALIVLGGLKKLEKGDSEGAQRILEMALDQALITDWADSRLPSKRPLFAPAEAYLDLTKPLTRIVAYWQLHPHDTRHAKEMVDWAITRYGMPPEALHSSTEPSDEQNHGVH